MVVSPLPPDSVRAWIDDLASNDAAVVESATQALIDSGECAVPELLRLLDSAEEASRLRAVSVLSLLGDPATAAPLAALTHEPSALLRRRAAGALARVPSATSVSALRRLMLREPNASVRLVATRSLVRLLKAGHDRALMALLGAISDPDEVPRVRAAAMDAIPWVAQTGQDGREPVRALLERLTDDPEPLVADKARRLLEIPSRIRLERWAVDQHLEDLGHRRLAVWRRAVTILRSGGSSVVEPVIDAMVDRPQDASYAQRASLILLGMSSRQLARVGPYLDSLDEPIVLKALVLVAESAGSRPLLARLAGLIERAASGSERNGPGPLHEVRYLAHLVLARSGSRLAAEDLRRLLDDPRHPVRVELTEAVGRIGTRAELPSLFRAYLRSRGVNRLAIREAAHAVARREKVRRTDRLIARLEPRERRAALEILGPSRAGRRGATLRGARIDSDSGPLLT